MTVTNDSKPDNSALAVPAILIAVFALSLGDAIIKQISTGFGIWQLFVMRSLMVVPVLAGFIALTSPQDLRLPRALGWTLVRSLLLVIMWISYYLSLPHLSLSAAAAAYYTIPIFITLFSALFIGEAIKTSGWIAVALGFAGVCLILRPKLGDFNAYSILPLLSAMLYALAMIITRSKCRAENPFILALSLNVAFVVFGAIATLVLFLLPDITTPGFLLHPWIALDGLGWMSMAILAIALLVGSVGAAIAYQNGPPTMIGTFDFAYVGLAVLWGFVFFGELPSMTSTLGLALIVTAGIIAIRSEKSPTGKR